MGIACAPRSPTAQDAVYFGLRNFNARHRAGSADGQSLRDQVKYLHDHNVRAYVAFNILIFSDELEMAAAAIVDLAASGADAVIVQDLGLARLLARMSPSLPMHGSTQMTLTDARGIEFVRRLGMQRVILPPRIVDRRDGANHRVDPICRWRHSCTGRCACRTAASALPANRSAARSANRGQCAQACRLPYDLIVDGRQADTPRPLLPLEPAGSGRL